MSEVGPEPANEHAAGADPGRREPPPAETPDHLYDHLLRLERLFGSGVHALDDVERRFVAPAWRRATSGEGRWPVTIAVLAAMAMQIPLPDRLAVHPRWLLLTLEALLLVGLFVANPKRIERQSAPLRGASIVFIGIISTANAWSAAKLVAGLVQGREGQNASQLLVTGGAIWLTNMIVFSLWYWELDRGGPVARANATMVYPDFLFAQMQSPDLAPQDWEPAFIDYLYLSFTNATAFSPTDVLPLTRWAKLTMMVQSAVSLTTVALVIARAVNTLR